MNTATRGLRVNAPTAGRWALVGKGGLAGAVAAAWPKDYPALVQWPMFDKHAPRVDGVIEATGSVAEGYDVVLTALARGIPALTANPLLMAAHGRVLAGADHGQGLLGFEAALLGSVPLAGLLGPGVQAVTVCFGGAADALLQRMNYRDEDLGEAEQGLRAQGVAMDDFGGRLTLARAVVLHGLWTGQWSNPAGVPRIAPEKLAAADAAWLRGAGLQLRYGARLAADGVFVGPMAVAAGTFKTDGATVLAETAFGTQALTAQGSDLSRQVSGLLREVGSRARLGGMAPTALAPMMHYVRGPVGQRAAVKAMGRIAQEWTGSDGTAAWLVNGARRAELQSVASLVLPVAGERELALRAAA